MERFILQSLNIRWTSMNGSGSSFRSTINRPDEGLNKETRKCLILLFIFIFFDRVVTFVTAGKIYVILPLQAR